MVTVAIKPTASHHTTVLTASVKKIQLPVFSHTLFRLDYRKTCSKMEPWPKVDVLSYLVGCKMYFLAEFHASTFNTISVLGYSFIQKNTLLPNPINVLSFRSVISFSQKNKFRPTRYKFVISRNSTKP